MSLRRHFLILISFLTAAGPGFSMDNALQTKEKRVQAYVSAYNQKDVEAMMKMVTDDVQWLYVVGDKIVVETKGKAALRKSLTAYFKGATGTTSELKWTQATHSRVAALEQASWPTKNGVKSNPVFRYTNSKET